MSLNSKGTIAVVDGNQKLCKEVLVRVVGWEFKDVEASMRHWELRNRVDGDTDGEGWTQVLEATRRRRKTTCDEHEELLPLAFREGGKGLPEPSNNR